MVAAGSNDPADVDLTKLGARMHLHTGYSTCCAMPCTLSAVDVLMMQNISKQEIHLEHYQGILVASAHTVSLYGNYILV
jgi:hypothetical protein